MLAFPPNHLSRGSVLGCVCFFSAAVVFELFEFLVPIFQEPRCPATYRSTRWPA